MGLPAHRKGLLKREGVIEESWNHLINPEKELWSSLLPMSNQSRSNSGALHGGPNPLVAPPGA